MNIENTIPSSSSARNPNIINNLMRGNGPQAANGFKFNRKQGKGIEANDRHWILRLFHWLKAQKSFTTMSKFSIMELIEDCSGCDYKTVASIIESGEIQPNDRRGHDMERKIKREEEEEIKTDIIRHLKNNLTDGIPVSSKDVRAWLAKQKNIDIGKTAMLDYLRGWGICWKELKIQEFRKEREYVQVEKHKFIAEVIEELKTPEKTCYHKRCKCPRKRALVYLDESYIHQHHVSQYGLTIENFPLSVPSGKGKRVVLAGAISEEGWLGYDYNGEEAFQENMQEKYESGCLNYWVANIGQDYHQNFDGVVFVDYFRDYVLPNLKKPSLLIMDGAKYHHTYAPGEFFPSKAKKEELKDWLVEKGIEFEEGLLKEELKMLAMMHWIPPKTLVQTLAEEHGKKNFGYPHRIIYTPPYHPEFNAVEMAWADVKAYIGKNPNYSLKDLLKTTIPIAFHQFTQQKARNVINHVVKRYFACENNEGET